MLWIVAVGIEYCGPMMRFAVAGFGAMPRADWEVEGGHMAERCALFIIIALGESVVVTGATFAETDGLRRRSLPLLSRCSGASRCGGCISISGPKPGPEISHARDAGRLARLSYTYLHLPIVAGIVVSAVGDQLLLAPVPGHADGKSVHQPQRRLAIAAVIHEGEPLGVGDEIACGFRGRPARGARAFVVEMEAVVGMPDGVDAFDQRRPRVAGAGAQAGKLPCRS
ncbi:low temperature requirement protein A [Streptomyces canarius]